MIVVIYFKILCHLSSKVIFLINYDTVHRGVFHIQYTRHCLCTVGPDITCDPCLPLSSSELCVKGPGRYSYLGLTAQQEQQMVRKL